MAVKIYPINAISKSKSAQIKGRRFLRYDWIEYKIVSTKASSHRTKVKTFPKPN